MKTHELARALTFLARALKTGPDIDLRQMALFRNEERTDRSPDIAVNLSTLVELSRIGKQHWGQFIEENRFPIQVRPRDASRDILGKLLRFLEKNPEARDRIRRQADHKRGQASPELSKALSWLLEESHS